MLTYVPLFCVLRSFCGVFANCAADGLYLEHQEVGIAQYLLTTFLPSQSCRKYLKLRKQQSVDFRAACFCHKKVVDIAYV